MNSVNLTGRLTRDPEIRYTEGGMSVASFSVAVDRRFKREGEQSADFINCKAFAKSAEFIEKWFRQGMKIEVTGRIQTGSYTNKDGIKVYTTDVIAESLGFAESKGAQQEDGGQPQGSNVPKKVGDDGFMNIPDGIDEELPFN